MNKIDKIKEILDLIVEVSYRLNPSDPILKTDYEIQDLGVNHKNEKLKNGYSGVYIFYYKDTCLKVGKANENSNNRFVYHHYGFRAPSTLAKSLTTDSYFADKIEEKISDWMHKELYRINIQVKNSKAKTELIELILHYALRPKYEGELNQFKRNTK